MIHGSLNNGWSCSQSWKGHFWNVPVSLHLISPFAYNKVNLKRVGSAAGGEGRCRESAPLQLSSLSQVVEWWVRLSHGKFQTVAALKTRRFWSGIILGLSCSHFTLIILTVRKHRKQWHTKFSVGLFWFFFSNNFVLLIRFWLAKTRLVFVLVRFLWVPEELSRQLKRKANNHMYLLWCFKFQGRGLDASRPLTWV